MRLALSAAPKKRHAGPSACAHGGHVTTQTHTHTRARIVQMQHNSTVSAVAAAVWRYSSDARACVRAYACTILYDNYLLATLCTTATVLLCMIFPPKTPYTTTATTIENRSGITVYYAASERRNTPPYVMGVCRRRLGQHFCRHNNTDANT